MNQFICKFLIFLLPFVFLFRERLNDQIGKKLKTDASERMGRKHLLGPPGTLNTTTPCAACKLLRRRCAQECPFSPYFSPHEPQKFASVHKVFGASNVTKMLMVSLTTYLWKAKFCVLLSIEISHSARSRKRWSSFSMVCVSAKMIFLQSRVNQVHSP